MKIKSIYIENYKSIKELTIPFESYGNSNPSKSTFLVGLNESGKSAILEAISLIGSGLDKYDYYQACYMPAQEENEYIDIYADLDTDIGSYLHKQIPEKCGIPSSIAEKLNFKSLKKNVFKNNESHGSSYEVKIEPQNFYEFFVETNIVTVNGKQVPKQLVKNLKEANNIVEKITQTNAESFLKEKQELLTTDKIEELIRINMHSLFDLFMPKIQMWKPTPEHLINDTISLSEFAEDPDISIPLKNMFHIFGKSNDKEIKLTIEKALKNQARTDELKDKMSNDITKHINKVWKEHKVKIRVSINGNDCEVHVEDKDKNYTYYKMNQRSDGFKQFISLILSLSAQNESNNLVNKIILIDEPEVHLHPSGVKYMRDELIKIGKNNFVFIATHSQYMVDTSCPERHWIVTKEKSQTKISQISEETSVQDDSVLASAFGLNFIKELLPENILIVEGNDDKLIITHTIKQLKPKFFCSFKSARGASKTPGLASLLNEEKVAAYFLFDDDKEGRDNRKRILDDIKESFSEKTVFTIRDLNKELPQNSTIEDLLPFLYVKEFFEKELNQQFSLDEKLPVIPQIKGQCGVIKENKQKLDSLKLKLAKSFCNDFDAKNKIENDAKRLFDFIGLLVKKIEGE